MGSLRTNEYKYFLKRLYLARANSGLTQIEVAKKLNKPQSFVSKCEQGERTVNALDLFHFANIYNVSIDFFFDGIEKVNGEL